MISNKKFLKKLKSGFFQAIYFNKEKEILKASSPDDIITIQWFQRHNNAILCGINESIELINHLTEKKVKIWALKDGDHINANDIVLAIKGKSYDVCPLEGIIDGILARSTSIATNAYRVKQAAKNKEVIFMGDRADHYITQGIDGYAAHVGGIDLQVTNAHVSFWGNKKNVIGSIPHSLIQAFGGDIIEALSAYEKTLNEKKIVALIDFNNDCVKEAEKVAHYFKDRLFAVRIDTSISNQDEYFKRVPGQWPEEETYGVNIHLIRGVRSMLDICGCHHTKIIVSSGMNPEKITSFLEQNAPIDYFGVGEYILNINIRFTGDAVELNDEIVAKVGRKKGDYSKLKKIQ
ncbi:nicotinate phosphoribosyltransferase [Mycoplasma sp. (ex Biomphalaria glabrata)]|uniref:nicotinate phosphoribosyltransferase n=1 Tax=Mycoplasma sp. (ex Biomphalaria glabrata) TaxID=1749074 RepID=UPI000B0DB579|nr:nicotinate phosphoribosyltransferase [Mycoplasma sp. (ex Biomphalaria glabrata)]